MNRFTNCIATKKKSSFQIILVAWMITIVPSIVYSQHRLIEKFDTDDNNIIERSELPKEVIPPFLKMRFGDIDCDKDDGISHQELMTFFKGGRGSCESNRGNFASSKPYQHRLIKLMDRDENGTIELLEIPPNARIRSSFGKIDCDKSGGISNAELVRFFRSGRSACPPGIVMESKNNKITKKFLELSSQLNQYSAKMMKPSGKGPYPVIIMSHGSGGAVPGYSRWGKLLVKWGVAPIIIDHYGPRGVSRAPSQGESIEWRKEDLLSLLKVIKDRMDVDQSNVSLAGWSAGAYLVFDGIFNEDIEAETGFNNSFRSAILFYPASQSVFDNFDLRPIQIPTIFLTGEHDRIWSEGDYVWQDNINEIRSENGSFYLKVYPNAIHGFESFPKILGKKCTPLNCLEYNGEAHQRSIVDLKTFIETYIIN